MELKPPQQRPAAVRGMWLRWVLGAAVYGAAAFSLGVYALHTGVITNTIKPLVLANVRIVPRFARSLFTQPEHVTIDVKHKHFMRLVEKRKAALKTGLLIASDDDFVPARIRYQDRTMRAKLRLKGDLGDHWRGNKWSFRVQLKGDEALFGLKRFSLQHPRTRDYIYEWVYHEALRREGLPAIRYQFVQVTLNGKDLGVYALEEHFDKGLVEHNRLREGPIVRFNEDLCWADILQQTRFLGHLEIMCGHYGSGSFMAASTDAFQSGRWLADEAGARQHARALELLEGFRRGDLRTSEVFDVEKLAKLLALTDLLGAGHAVNWRNARFYYNPVTARLEAIGFDAFGHGQVPIRSLLATLPSMRPEGKDNLFYYHEQYFARLFDDLDFYRAYVVQLERMQAPGYLEQMLAALQPDIQRHLDVLYREFPYAGFTPDTFYRNREFIRTVLSPAEALHAYYQGVSECRLELQVGNLQYLPVEVVAVAYDGAALERVDGLTLPGRAMSEAVRYRPLSVPLPDCAGSSAEQVPALKVHYRIPGSSHLGEGPVIPWSLPDGDLRDTDLVHQAPNADQFPFVIRDDDAKVFLIAPGDWTVDQDLIFPAGYKVAAREGTRLNLAHGATMVSFSPLDFTGSEDRPIVIESKESDGQGLLVTGARKPSTLEHVVFRNLANPSKKGWELLGAVNFYESPVSVSSCHFVGNRSEDGVNVIRSDFKIARSVFEGTQSDAFDADFADGMITDSVFAQLGNDAVDVSGSRVTIARLSVRGAGDKGVSVGEDSHVTLEHARIDDAKIGLASKDHSQLVGRDIRIRRGEIGVAAYQKKAEFGAASITLDGVDLQGATTPYLVEPGSTVVVDGKPVPANREKVAELLYAKE